jgi:endoglucanase
LNISNFDTDAANGTYGSAISALIGNKHFVVDTSRNGNGPTSDNQWCNPSGRALGHTPTTVTGNALIDAYLWVKHPGESDGTCNGGPAAGVWWPDQALSLATNAGW